MHFPSSLASSWTSAQTMVGKFDHSEFRKKARQCFHAYISNRKLVAGTVLFFLLLLYFFPGWFGLGSSVSSSPGVAWRCLDDQLRHYYRLESTFQVHTQHYPVNPDKEKAFVPFVGNGRLGVAFGVDQQLRVSAKRSLSTTTNLHPLVTASINHAHSSSAFVTDYQKGQMKKIDCYAFDDECVSIITTVFAHRKYPHLLVQEIQIANPLAHSIEVTFGRPSNKWKEIERNVDGSVTKVMTSSVDTSDNPMAIAAVMTTVPPTISVQGKRQENIRFTAAIDYSDPIPSDQLENQRNIVADRVIKLHRNAARLTAAKVDQEHETAWRTLNDAVFGISLSLAPDALNADLINATRYAVMTNSRAPLVEDGVSDEDRKLLTSAQAQTELCYNGHSTLMLPSRLWRSLATVSDLLEVAETWILTLEKNGCMHLVRAGASGTAQAMLLSFGTLKFSHHHLEFDVDPGDLHRDYSFTGILIDGLEGPKVSVWVEVGSDNKAMLYASVERSNPNRRVFACDAGCLDAPVELKESKTQFPVKQTLPLTPILYLTSDKSHLEELKQTIHVKEVAIAPAHEHHVLALHKHGHRLGGLPTLFWVTLAFLIIAFHLFLFKLVYNEWLRGDTKTYSRYEFKSRAMLLGGLVSGAKFVWDAIEGRPELCLPVAGSMCMPVEARHASCLIRRQLLSGVVAVGESAAF
uniref:Transmembrane protein n=1 Tax=Plectus sambesii TaxID=2011161 RepID=A0A914VT87_9BILA